MNNLIERYLVDQSDRLVFISLKDEKLLNHEALINLKDIEIPIFSNVVADIGYGRIEGISSYEIAKAMLYMMGIDSGFIYNEYYKEFLEGFTDSVLNLVNSLAEEGYRNNNFINSIIYSRAYLIHFEMEDNLLINYALVCREYAQTTDDEIKKDIFTQESEDILYPFFQEKIEKVQQYIENEEFPQAMVLLNEVLERDKNNFDANFYKGYIHRIQGEYDEALDSFEIAFEIDSKVPILVNEMALAFSFLGDLEQALELFLYARTLDSQSVDIITNIAMIYYNLNQQENARKYINMALNMNPLDEIALSAYKEISRNEKTDN